MSLPQPDSLHGKIAVITGAASGIGAATAEAFAQRGASLILHTRRNQTGLTRVVDSLRAYLTAEPVQLLADFRQLEQQDHFLEQAWAVHGKIDIWVNNAGADVLTGEAANWSFERKLAEVWQVDVVSTMRLSRTIGARMTALNDSAVRSIINLGWDQATQGMAGESGEIFAASKGAIMAFSRSLAQSLAPRVRVNCVAPGWIQTAWGEQASGQWDARAKAESLLHRWGTPRDVAAAIAFLASDAAAFINGQTLPVNGGFRYGFGTSAE